MAKELLLYNPIFNFTAEDLITGMEENKSEDVSIRVNSPGGNVRAGWGIIAKMQEHGSIKIKVDGGISSMSTWMLVFAHDSEALDVSNIHLHRATMFVDGPADQAFLDKVNKDLRAKLESKIDVDKFKKITGFTLDQLFDAEQRIEVNLTASEAKEIGLVNKVVVLTPEEAKAFNDKLFSVAADATPPAKAPEKKPVIINEPKTNKMTIEKITAEHPELIKEIQEKAITAERDRVGAWAAFLNADSEKVIKAIKEGTPLSQTDMSELMIKANSPEVLAKIEADNATAAGTDEAKGGGEDKDVELTEKEKKDAEAFEKEVDGHLNINTKTEA